MEIKVQPLHQRNIDDILRIQKAAYGEMYLEDADSFIAKIIASPATSFAAWNDSLMIGYLIAVPLQSDDGLHLNTSDVPTVPLENATVMYIHDVAVHPEARGDGVAQLLLQHLEDAVSGTSISQWLLVSVQGSHDFWVKQGFAVSPRPAPNGYGAEAVLMLRR